MSRKHLLSTTKYSEKAEQKMAKKSPAKIKMLAAEAKRNAAAQREMKKASNEIVHESSTSELDRYESLDGAWRQIGIAAPARRALVDEGLFELSDLRKMSLAALKDLHGMGPNAVRILIAEMKKQDLAFRK
jgi:hypothetical protein